MHTNRKILMILVKEEIPGVLPRSLAKKKIRSGSEQMTINRSKMFHPTLKYSLLRAVSLIMASTVNTMVKTYKMSIS